MTVVLSRLRGLLPGAADYAGFTTFWRNDLVAGLTVAVVALPLALAFGITTGLGAEAGIVTAIVAGLVAAFFGGSAVQVSGPTGAMTVVLVPLVARHGPGGVATVGVVAGALIIVAAASGIGRYVEFIPWPVVEGFTLGIAVVIALQQVPAALGVARPRGDNTAVVAFHAVMRATAASRESLVILGVVAVVMIGGSRLRRTLPVSLLGVGAGTAVAALGHLDVSRIGALPAALPTPSLPGLSPARISEAFGPALAVAALVALESLLSAKVADGMSDGPRHDPDRELFGQGLANVVSPMFGGMPATGAIARTALNVRAGARTRVAAMVHSGVLVLVVLFGGDLVGRIPIAALAGVLLVTAARMVEVHNLRAICRASRSDALVMGATAAATVVFDLILAVEIGIAVAAALALRELARSTTFARQPWPDEFDSSREHRLLDDHIVVYRVDGPLFFGATQRFLSEFTAISNVRAVVLRLSGMTVLDASGANALRGLVEEMADRNIAVALKVPRAEHRRMLAAVAGLGALPVFDDLDDAIAYARRAALRLDGKPAP